jgi:hypothetical protein
LVPILDGDPTAPTGNRVIRNIFVGEGWDDIHPAARTYILLEDNVTDEDSPFVAAPPSSFQLRGNASALALGFQPIPFEAMGLYPEKDP